MNTKKGFWIGFFLVFSFYLSFLSFGSHTNMHEHLLGFYFISYSDGYAEHFQIAQFTQKVNLAQKMRVSIRGTQPNFQTEIRNENGRCEMCNVCALCI